MKAADQLNLRSVIARLSSLLFVSGTAGSFWLIQHELFIKTNEMLELTVLNSLTCKIMNGMRQETYNTSIYYFIMAFYISVFLNITLLYDVKLGICKKKMPVFLNM